MNWTEIFPILTEELVEEFHEKVTEEERMEFEFLFGVDRIINESESQHVLAISLFWKNVDGSDQELPAPTRELMKTATEKGLVRRYAPWEHYVQPLLKGAKEIQAKRPEITVRVYLAADLAFLIPDLTAVGCEIYLMKSSSIRHNPGAMWRFLSLEDAGYLVTVMDADRLPDYAWVVRRTESLREMDAGTWRITNAMMEEVASNGCLNYRPIQACHFGTKVRENMRDLMEAFLWHTRRGTFWEAVCYPQQGIVPIFGTKWPSYGFDEWFLMVAMYPRLAASGFVTSLNTLQTNWSVVLDTDYAAWASPHNVLLTPLAPAPHHPPRGPPSGRFLHLGCSDKHLPEPWENTDADQIDITKPLPCENASVRYIFLEHVIEHVTARDAWNFFQECRRVLMLGGVLRLAFPDIVQIQKHAPSSYDAFFKNAGWGDGTRESTVRAAIFEHGHQAVWTAESMTAVLEAQGFHVSRWQPRHSANPDLVRLDQHWLTVGREINAAETVCLEAAWHGHRKS